MIKIIDGDLLDSNADIICHQVNCQGVMGSGVAKQIKDNFPNVFQKYSELCGQYINKEALLGTAQKIYCPDKKIVIFNLFAQCNYGYNGNCYTDLYALRKCLEQVHSFYKRELSIYPDSNLRLALPYKIGCVRGGADWNIVEKIIDEIFNDCTIELWRLDKG